MRDGAGPVLETTILFLPWNINRADPISLYQAANPNSFCSKRGILSPLRPQNEIHQELDIYNELLTPSLSLSPFKSSISSQYHLLARSNSSK